MTRILFLLKADQLGLFDTATMQAGYVNQHGTFVAPAATHRKKRAEAPKARDYLGEYIAKKGGEKRIASMLDSLNSEQRARILEEMAKVGKTTAAAVEARLTGPAPAAVADDLLAPANAPKPGAEKTGFKVGDTVEFTVKGGKKALGRVSERAYDDTVMVVVIDAPDRSSIRVGMSLRKLRNSLTRVESSMPAKPKRPATDFKYFADFAKDRTGGIPAIGTAAHAELKAEWDAKAAVPEDGGFDGEKFDRERNQRIKASRDAGNVHVDRLGHDVESLRGKKISYLHGDEKGTITTADNNGFWYVRWDTGPYAGSQTMLHGGDKKDYAVLNPNEHYDPAAFVKQRKKWSKSDKERAAKAEKDKEGETRTVDGIDYVRLDGKWRMVDPKEGDTKTEDGIEYQLKGGRWHKITQEIAENVQKQPTNVAESENSAPDYSAPFVSANIPQFGVDAGVTKTERKRLNKAARDILHSKETGFTDAEKATLSKYSGNGGVGDSLNEFYTRPDIAGATWKILNSYGVDRGEVLEPSCGPGVFAATAPAGAKVVGVELDPTSARIAGILHERHEINQSSMEGFAVQDVRRFAGVVGNAPFGPRGALLAQDKPDLPTAEQYFLDTSIDKTVPGGIVALIVPTGIMDNANTRAFRENLLKKAEFIGAHRMPNTAFEHAHTGVTTDLVVFRRRPDEIAGALSVLGKAELEALGLWDSAFVSGAWFESHPERIYGKQEAGWRAKAGMGNDITVEGAMNGVADAIAKDRPGEGKPVTVSMQDILALADGDEAKQRKILRGSVKQAYEHAKVGDTKTIGGIQYMLTGQPPRWHRVDGAEVPEAVEDAEDLAGQLDELFARGHDAADPAHIAEIQAALSAYVKKHGIPSANKELKDAAGQDKRLWRLIGAVNKDGSFSSLVTGKEADNAGTFEGIAGRLSREMGSFTVDDLSREWGHERDDVLDQLFASPHYAVTLGGNEWVAMDDYLTGNLWLRYDEAKLSAANEGLSQHYRDRYAAQVAALEAAIDPKPLDDAFIELNSAWIPTAMIGAWSRAKVAEWEAANPGASWHPEPITVSFDKGIYKVGGTFGYAKLIETYLNRTGVRKDDLGTVAELNQEFRDWLLSSEYREKMEDLYNRKFRGFKEKDYANTAIDVPGLNPDYALNDYHWGSLKQALDMGKGIIAADVGLGKTPRGLVLAKLLKTSGQAKKPMIVAPKSVLVNWVAEINNFFPGSKIMVIGENMEKGRADNEIERNAKYHELSQNNDYDFVLISQPAFNDLDLNPIKKGEYQEQDFWTQRGDSLGQAGDKKRNDIRERYQQALAGRDFRKRADSIWFDELGVDALIVDEAHAYKNLYAAKARFGDSPKFLGGQGLSKRALDLNVKAKWIRENNGGKNIYGLTATPTANSPLEIYSMLSHICPDEFESRGIMHAEHFLDRYARFEQDLILTTGGGIEEATVTAGFQNMGELRELMRKYIWRQTAEQVGLKLPQRQDRQHLVDMTAQQQAVYSELRALAEDKSKSDTSEAHIFSIMSSMQKAGVDLELYDPVKYAGAVSPKYDAAAKEIVSGLKDGGQVVFMDYIDGHEKMAQRLVAAGIPRDQIGIINADEAESGTKRQKISDDFNKGKLRVVIGNTATMGEGINLQKGTTDIHHLDLTWNPAGMQQRNGRGLRQGNKMEAVRIHSYLARGSFDGYRHQTIASKKNWQDALWSGGDTVDNFAREGKISDQDMKVMLAADPDEARKIMDANRALHDEIATEAGRARSGEVFVKFQDMKRTLGALKDKTGATARKLADRIEKARTQLKHDKYFDGKEALDAEGDALVQPKSGAVFVVGKAFEMQPGPSAPINYSNAPSKWVVTGIDARSGTVRARLYGGDVVYKMDIAKMSEVKPVKHDAAAENSERSRSAVMANMLETMKALKLESITHESLTEYAARAADAMINVEKSHGDDWHKTDAGKKAMATALEGVTQHESLDAGRSTGIAHGLRDRAVMAKYGVNPDELKEVKQLRDIPPELVEREMPMLQALLKRKGSKSMFSGSRNGQYGGNIALENRETGRLEVVPNYGIGRMLETHAFPFPTPENRQKAIDAWVDAQMTRKINTKYQEQRGRKSSYGSYNQPRTGVKATYGDSITTENPWTGMGTDLFGEEFHTAAQAALQKQVRHRILSSGDFTEALSAAMASGKVAYDGRIHFDHDALDALWLQADTLGVLNKPVNEAVKLNTYNHGNGFVHEGVLYQADKYGGDRAHYMDQNTKVIDALNLFAKTAKYNGLPKTMDQIMNEAA